MNNNLKNMIEFINDETGSEETCLADAEANDERDFISYHRRRSESFKSIRDYLISHQEELKQARNEAIEECASYLEELPVTYSYPEALRELKTQ